MVQSGIDPPGYERKPEAAIVAILPAAGGGIPCFTVLVAHDPLWFLFLVFAGSNGEGKHGRKKYRR